MLLPQGADGGPLTSFTLTVFIASAYQMLLNREVRTTGPLSTGRHFRRSCGVLFDFDYWLRAFRALPGRIGFVDAVQALVEDARPYFAAADIQALRAAAEQAVCGSGAGSAG